MTQSFTSSKEEELPTVVHAEGHEQVHNVDSESVEPNWWWKYRQMIREPAAEFTGVMLLVIFGTGVDCQVVLSSSTAVAPSPKGVRIYMLLPPHIVTMTTSGLPVYQFWMGCW